MKTARLPLWIFFLNNHHDFAFILKLLVEAVYAVCRRFPCKGKDYQIYPQIPTSSVQKIVVVSTYSRVECSVS